MSKPTATIGAWQPDRTAPLFVNGEPVGKIIQLWGWYDLEFATGLRWAGGKTITKALSNAAIVYRTYPEARAN